MRLTTFLLTSALVSALPYDADPPPSEQVPFEPVASPRPTPPPGSQTYTDIEVVDKPSTPEKRAAMAKLLDKYAPVFKLASTERYYPSSVPFMLEHYEFVQWENGTQFEPNNNVFTASRLNKLPHKGRHQYLSVTQPHNPQPLVDGPESHFLYGPAGMPGGMEFGDDGRGRVHDEVYGFWVDNGRGVVDLWYWTYYPYNLGKEVGYLGWLGNHVSDWERLRVRTVNGTAESADFNTHSGGAFSAGTYRWSDLERFGERPIAYVASGSHGVWPNPGKHVYAQLLNLWQLVDMTDDYGAIWDTQGHVVPIEWWTGPDLAHRIRHTGNHSWLEFEGMFGNAGSSNCWWHSIVGVCQLVGGPIGPNRWFGDPPDCIIGRAAPDHSKYLFYLSLNVTKQARAMNVSTILVEQICARPEVALNGEADWNTLRADQMKVWTVPGRAIPFRGTAQHHATAEPCGGGRSAAKAYRLALYNKDGERVSTSNLRVLCMYEPGKRGWVLSPAVDVEDVDEWRWMLMEKQPEEPPSHTPPSPTSNGRRVGY
ncbi:hypothetical protein CcaverHIS002_0510680 [Cutaneotrichosporon cavernicola]|uniref:Vacuolar protein sorting-associated protein 62 n=1 Tax=Cutaneotrichosporon cavernicola TaxID=279322 RepID=A0AA48QXK8_9TREE|nr:uncharacterized protein CcaverHIS019_0511240 [Cutaneotrichosporon cavernicola]BEI85667.1 hypothetical protein CcaverHIS002_0510680 [Cutaneotrichosporon cavernicola]BEI93496.1 hypothetical protein CcaverHIS019_0511240 [Cutaneotrichosporon cavernicola]BEJ01275.1 hypothetical protein CcaverHIS631_0511320 [Cutaneotrichosporon cavernicola]BEJ09042.1 hypothetical protein CcaverHIS641_0511360 [Cutaneotrichosporon cavernicola]